MACPASNRLVALASLTVLKNGEDLEAKIVSSNKLSTTKFVCPEPGCGKSVDVYYRPEGMAKIRHHAAKGERVSMLEGKGRGTKVVSLTGIADLHKKAMEAFETQMKAIVEKAETTLRTTDEAIEMQLAFIKNAEAKIESLKADKKLAEEILASPEYSQHRKAV